MDGLNSNPVTDRWLWLWYSPYGFGGVENFLRMITSKQRPPGEHFIASVQTLDGPLKAEYDKQNTTIFDWSSFYAAYMRRIPAEKVCEALCQDISKIQPTVIMVNGCTDFGIGAAPLLKRLSAHAHIFDTFHIDPVDDAYLTHRRPYLRYLDGLISSNPGAFTKMNRMYPQANKLPTAYIPYAARVGSLDRHEPSASLKLLYLGRLDEPQKRVSLIPKILSTARQFGAKFTLTVAGDGPERARLEEGFRAEGLEQCVRFLGYVPQNLASDLLREHDCLLNVSLFEGFSISVIEALAAGCVPICTRLENMDFNVLVERENCLLCDVDQPLDMARIISNLKPATIRQMSHNAMRTGKQFTPDRMAQAYQAFIEEVGKKRTLLPYPVTGFASRVWDITKCNPWLFRTHPAKRWLRKAWDALR